MSGDADYDEDWAMLQWCSSIRAKSLGYVPVKRKYRGMEFNVMRHSECDCIYVFAMVVVAGEPECLDCFDYSFTGHGIFYAVRNILMQESLLERPQKRINELEACILDMANGGG